MATPGDLIRAMASVLGISEGTAFQFDRQLAEAGLRTKGGRGRSAAQVTAQDAANLLIAIAAAPIAGPAVKDAARTCETYGSLPLLSSFQQQAEAFANCGLPSLSKLPAKHTFRFATAALISAAAKGEAFGVPDQGTVFDCDLMFAIEFDGPAPRAEITGDGSMGEHDPQEYGRLIYGRKSVLKRREPADMWQKRIVTFKTIRQLAALLRQN
jgi:hypothetical protein